MTDTPTERSATARLSQAYNASTPDLRDGGRPPQTIDNLAERVKADPSLWDRLSQSQKVSLGFRQREQDRAEQDRLAQQRADRQAEDAVLAGYRAAGIGSGGAATGTGRADDTPTTRQRDAQRRADQTGAGA